MEIIDIAAGVFIGNLLTVCFLWCAREAGRHKDERKIPGWALGGLALPLIFSAGLLLAERLG